jgi:hypothetical protein
MSNASRYTGANIQLLPVVVSNSKIRLLVRNEEGVG